jgi:glycosyltransferase involved in cell wall biosynthesis
MKILVLNWQDRTNPFAGGAETHLHEIFSRIAALGHQVTLYCSSYAGAAPSEILDGMRVIREGGRNVFNYYAPYRYKRDFSRQGFDIVIDDVNKIPFFTPLYVREPLLAIAHHLFGKSIFLEAGALAGLYVYGAESLLARAYRRVPFAVVSESARRELTNKGIPPENLTVITNCISPDLLQTALRLEQSELNGASEFSLHDEERVRRRFVIAYFGRLKRYKSVHHLIEAFARIADEFPLAEAHIIGKGDAEPELRAIARKLGLNSPERERVRFLGYVPEERKIEMLSSAYCVVNPSLKEGWGIVNIEANACGAPVIAANTPGLRDAVRHGESGLLYEYGDIDGLAATLRTLMNDATLHRRLRAGALRFARQFDWDNSAREMLLLMKRVAADFYR